MMKTIYYNVDYSELAPQEVEVILNAIGTSVSKKYNQNLFFGSGTYNLGLLKDALQFESNADEFSNTYYVDAGDDDLNKIATYFEYGTGIFNTKGPKQMITPVSARFMAFQVKIGRAKKGASEKGGWVFTKAVKGVKPIFMFKRTMKWAENERDSLTLKTLKRLGYN